MSLPSSSRSRPALHRGLACLVCRKRKIRCDAVKPNCSACQKLIANWRPETGAPKPVCIYDPIPPNAPIPASSSSSVNTTSRSRDETASFSNSAAPYPSFSSSSSPTSTTTPTFQQRSTEHSEASYRAQASSSVPSSSRKRGPSERSPSENQGEEQQHPPSLSRSRSQTQARNKSETATSYQFTSSDKGTEYDPFRTYSKLPRRASSPGLSHPPWREGDAESSSLPPLLSTSTTSNTTIQPSKLILDRLVNLFFKHCSISSIVRKDLYSVDQALSGSDLDLALLRAILSIAVLYSSSIEDILGCFWKVDGREVALVDAQTVGIAHASAARSLLDRYRSNDGAMEEILPVSLLLVFQGMHTFTPQEELQVQSEISWSAIAVRRLGLYNLPSSTTTPSDVPSISQPSSSTTLWKERSRRFWAFYVLDRQFQARRAAPPLLSEQDISTPLPSSEDGQRISPSSRSQTSMSLDSSIFVTTQTRELSWLLFVQAVRLFSMSLNQRLRRREDDGVATVDQSFAADVSELENQTQILSSQVDKEVPKPVTHLSTIRLLIRASQIVSLESNDRRSLSSPTLDCLDASRAIAETARSIQPSSLRYLDFFEINSFWIGARSLIRYLASDTRQLSVSQDEIVEDFKSTLGCLWKHGPRGKLLTKALMALYKTIDSSTGFLSTPSFWPVEAVISIRNDENDERYSRSNNRELQTTSLLHLTQQVEDSELAFLNR